MMGTTRFEKREKFRLTTRGSYASKGDARNKSLLSTVVHDEGSTLGAVHSYLR
jgi:hypothetical protein